MIEHHDLPRGELLEPHDPGFHPSLVGAGQDAVADGRRRLYVVRCSAVADLVGAVRFACRKHLVAAPRPDPAHDEALIIDLFAPGNGRHGFATPAAAVAEPAAAARNGPLARPVAALQRRWAVASRVLRRMAVPLLVLSAAGLTAVAAVPGLRPPPRAAELGEPVRDTMRGFAIARPLGWHLSRTATADLIVLSRLLRDRYVTDWLDAAATDALLPRGAQFSVEHRQVTDMPELAQARSAKQLASMVLERLAPGASLHDTVLATTFAGEPALRFRGQRRGRWIEAVLAVADWRVTVLQMSAPTREATRQLRPTFDALMASVTPYP